MNPIQLIERASTLVAKGKLEPALRDYQEALAKHPQSTLLLEKVAELCALLGRKREAADCLEKAAGIFAEQASPQRAAGLYKRLLEGEFRIDACEKLAALREQLGQGKQAAHEWWRVGSACSSGRLFKRGLHAFQRVVALDPDDVSARLRLGELIVHYGERDEGLAELRCAADHFAKRGLQAEQQRVLNHLAHLGAPGSDGDDVREVRLGLPEEAASSVGATVEATSEGVSAAPSPSVASDGRVAKWRAWDTLRSGSHE